MLNRLSINFRMLIMISVPALILILVGYISLTSIGEAKKAQTLVHGHSDIFTYAFKVDRAINIHYTQLLINIDSNFIFWNAASESTQAGIKSIEKLKNKWISEFEQYWTAEQIYTPEVKSILVDYDQLMTSYKELQPLFLKEENEVNREVLKEYVQNTMLPLSNTISYKIQSYADTTRKVATTASKANIKLAESNTLNILYAIFVGMLIAMVLGSLILSSISKPAKQLTDVVKRLTKGEFNVRAEIQGNDEFTRLSSAFNELLDDRAISLSSSESEHQELNQSVFKLLQAVAELSERNLTIRAEVTEDATGPVADAINLLAEETASTLMQVRDVAAEVNNTSQSVNSHLMSVNKLAMREQEQAIETADQMDKMLERLDAVANSAAETNSMADIAKTTTTKAHESVSSTLAGMSDIRETVQETGKRIKQLGERSQEISHVIDIINTIAERTTVLALNASMQAVAAGDAGRGFSVIAEEIQRLAESSRESTGQISTLVRNIQQETNTTIATMDKTIEQVVDGSTRAEDAAEQMKEVLETTTQLVQSVDLIASSSREQVEISESLKHKAQSILKSTQSTGQELLSLTGLSRNMSDYAQQLVQSVNVFTIEKDTETEKAEA